MNKKLTSEEIKKKLLKLKEGLSLTDDWPWKPYKGWTVEATIKENAGYVHWAILKGINLNREAEIMFEYEHDIHLQNKNDTFDWFDSHGFI